MCASKLRLTLGNIAHPIVIVRAITERRKVKGGKKGGEHLTFDISNVIVFIKVDKI